MIPKTMTEWVEYIQQIPEKDILSKAKAANSLEFLRGMGAEGMSPKDVGGIVKAFASRLVELDISLPTQYDGALWDMSKMLD
jgi:hypothetical protein